MENHVTLVRTAAGVVSMQNSNFVHRFGRLHGNAQTASGHCLFGATDNVRTSNKDKRIRTDFSCYSRTIP